MSSPIPQNLGQVSEAAGAPPNQAAPVVKADAQTAGLAAQENYSAVSSKTKIRSMNELRDKAPEVEKAMMQGIAQRIIEELKDAEERRKKMAQEYKR